MPASDDIFDFSDQTLNFSTTAAEPIEEPVPSIKKQGMTKDDEISTSYLLVNVLLNLLVQKGIIQTTEVNSLLSELHKQYMEKRKGGDADAVG